METKKTVIIDVRTPGEYAMGNVQGSINIPLDTLPNRIDEIKQMGANIILCCASGARSNSALMYLKQNGIADVQDGGPWNYVANQMMN